MAWWREEEEEKRDRSNGWAGPPQCISTIFYGTPEHRVQYMYGTDRNGCNSGLIYDNCFQRAHTHTMGLPSSSSFFYLAVYLCATNRLEPNQQVPPILSLYYPLARRFAALAANETEWLPIESLLLHSLPAGSLQRNKDAYIQEST